MPFLYEKIDTLREVGVQKELPQYMQENLNRNFELRPYQIKAFENFITYFETINYVKTDTNTFSHGDRLRKNIDYGRFNTVPI